MFIMHLLLANGMGKLVPQTAWTRHVMRFHSEHILRQNWSETSHFRYLLDDVKTFKKTPSYFHAPLHGFQDGGPCVDQALQQAPSMRFIMKTFQCDDYYREMCYKQVLEQLDTGKGLAVDIGCGSGDSSAALRENVDNDVIGFDLSRAMVKLARKRTGLKIYTADAASLPLPDNSVSVLTCFALFHEMPRGYSRKVLSEFARVVQKGGHVIIWDQNPDKIGSFQYDLTNIPIEPYLLSFKKLDIAKELRIRGFSTTETTDRFMRSWVATKK